MIGMYGTFLALFTILCCGASRHLGHANNVVPVIHTIHLENNTYSIPPEYMGLPVVGKCCPINEVLVKNELGETMCVPSNSSSSSIFSPRFSNYNRTGILVPGDKHDRFVAVVGNPCEYRRYVLFPENLNHDKHYLMVNGSIYAPHHTRHREQRMLLPGADYCMEYVPGLELRTFVCFTEDRVINMADSRITFYASGLLISVPFLMLTIVAYSITPKLKDVHGKALCHYCGCLALAFTTLAITQLTSVHLSDQACVGVAFVIQFSFVACFFWLNVMCIETWLLIRRHVCRGTYTRTEPKTLFFYYSMWAWGPPAILVLVSMVMDLSPTIPLTYVKPNFGSETCWFKADPVAMPYFYVPVGLLLLGNLILFVLASVKISRHQRDLALRRLASNQETHRLELKLFEHLRRTFFVCFVLFFLMGLNWSMELISWGVGGDPLDWSAFDFINALQGVLVFGLFVLRRPPRDFIWRRIQKLRGANVTQPEIGNLNSTLLPVMNGDAVPGQTVIV